MDHQDHCHDHCDCGCEHDDCGPFIINTVDENGNELTFEVLEIFEFEGKEYARLQSCDEDQDEDEDLLMEFEQVGDECEFHSIEDDDLFRRIVVFLDATMDEDECECEDCDCDEDDGEGGCDCGCHCHHD